MSTSFAPDAPSRDQQASSQPSGSGGGPGFFVRNGLLLVCFFVLFLGSIVGQSLAGQRAYNAEQEQHGEEPVAFVEYLGSGHFIEGVFENWESEFLQMASYVLLTVWLRQKGSPESKKLDGDEPVDEDPNAHRDDPGAPWPARRGGLALALYRNSLSIAFFLLFFLSMWLHALGGTTQYNEEQAAHGGEPVSTLEFARTSEFWYQSLQNWQSEFLAVAALVGLSIFLRQQGSPESKPVHEPHAATGSA